MTVKAEHLARLSTLGLSIPQMEAVLDILGEATKGRKKSTAVAGLFDRVEAEAFERFYFNYPRKQKRGNAEAAWGKARTIAEAATLIEGALRYAKIRAGENHQYTLLPASWLNAKGWLDQHVIGGASETHRGNGNNSGPDQRMGGYGAALDLLGKR